MFKLPTIRSFGNAKLILSCPRCLWRKNIFFLNSEVWCFNFIEAKYRLAECYSRVGSVCGTSNTLPYGKFDLCHKEQRQKLRPSTSLAINVKRLYPTFKQIIIVFLSVIGCPFQKTKGTEYRPSHNDKHFKISSNGSKASNGLAYAQSDTIICLIRFSSIYMYQKTVFWIKSILSLSPHHFIFINEVIICSQFHEFDYDMVIKNFPS